LYTGRYAARVVTFLQRRVHPLIAGLILATLLTSVVCAVDARQGGALYHWLALVPERVWHGELWRLVTWTLVEGSALGLVFTCISLYWFGGALLSVWGPRRFARYLATIVLVAAVGTCLVSLWMSVARYLPQLAGVAVTDALVIAWAFQFPERQVRIYGILPLGGETLAHVTLWITGLFALFYGVVWFLPDLIAGLAALAIATGMPRRLWRRIRERRFGVVPGGRHGGPYAPN
jgi:membrane associated rhomboid family serine protease